MRKSVIKSMIIGSLSVMLISLIILTFVFFYSIKSNVNDEKYREMDECIEHVKPLTHMSLEFTTSKMLRMYDIFLQQFSHFSDYNLIICNKQGQVIWADIEYPYSMLQTYTEPATKKFGEKTTMKFSRDFDDIYNEKTLTIGEVVKSETTDDAWVIFCTSKAPAITKQFVDILIEVMVMELAALLFMAIFLYLFSRNITNPLNKMNIAVNDFSKGNFSRRVEYYSENELGELAENINNMAQSIETLEKTRSNFISDISHELRTPMTSISGFVEGMLDGTISKEDYSKYLKIVLSECKRLTRLINDLLSISRFDNNQKTINLSEFDVIELIKVALIKFEKDITEKQIDVNFQSSTEACNVYADKDSITQVLINLIHNAVKFTDINGYINISLNKEKDKCILTFENSGKGIDEENLNFVWERFYKTDNSRSNDRSGVGLGLYIVKRIIDAHGEKIYVSSEPGKSTAFTFTLSLAQSN